jgi:uncharacterized membrane protein
LIASWHSPDGHLAGFRLKGNFSMGAGGLAGLILALGAVTLVLAGLLAWQGYWPVLAIAVIQVVLVTWLLIRTWERAWMVDDIEIDSERITVTQRRYKRIRQLELATAWAVVEVEMPDVAWYEPVVRLRSGRTSVELGSFLTGEERHRLARQLKSAVKKYSAL